jgi:hypothetical protein
LPEESAFFPVLVKKQIPRCARDDKIADFFRGLLNRDQRSDHEWVIPDGSENSPEDTCAIIIPLGTKECIIKFIFISYIRNISNPEENGFAAPGK